MRAYKCPCGNPWPCTCREARTILGLERPAAHPEDEMIVGRCHCPKCGEAALIEIDPEDVVEWEADTLVVREVGPAMGACCNYLFAMQPDGHVIAMEHKED